MAVLQRFGRTSSGNRCSIHLFLQCSWKWMPRCKNGILFLKWKKVYTLEWYHNPANQWERNRRVNGNCALHLMGVWSCPHRACLNAKPAVYCPEIIPARRPHRESGNIVVEKKILQKMCFGFHVWWKGTVAPFLRRHRSARSSVNPTLRCVNVDPMAFYTHTPIIL